MSDLPLDFVGMLEFGKYHEPPSKRQGKWFNQIDLAGSLLTFPDWAQVSHSQSHIMATEFNIVGIQFCTDKQ